MRVMRRFGASILTKMGGRLTEKGEARSYASGTYLLRVILMHNEFPIFHVILGLNYASI